MWLTLLLPVLCVSVAAAVSVLFYSLQKAVGPIQLPSFSRKKAEAPHPKDSDQGTIIAHRQSGCNNIM